jgi:hypothetical protein
LNCCPACTAHEHSKWIDMEQTIRLDNYCRGKVSSRSFFLFNASRRLWPSKWAVRWLLGKRSQRNDETKSTHPDKRSAPNVFGGNNGAICLLLMIDSKAFSTFRKSSNCSTGVSRRLLFEPIDDHWANPADHQLSKTRKVERSSEYRQPHTMYPEWQASLAVLGV